ncbi:Valine--tRNA ligase [subsurface metagenome]
MNTDTLVWIYTYRFESACLPIVDDKYALKKCPSCNKGKLRQETDVLDTWFSSALWPFVILGWPKKTRDLKEFYPNHFISSDRNIVNLWIARMIFSGLEFMKTAPFKTAYIHATILTKTGQRMSKSLGTGINPLELIEKYGSDATRFGLIWQTTGVQDIRFDENNIVMGKKFCNKIWNATRFVLQQTANSKLKAQSSNLRPKAQNLTKADKEIIKNLDKTIKSVDKNIENFQFGQAAQTLYHFFWHDFCDIYIEKSKSQKEKENTKKILLYVLLTSLKLLHPFMPFITEEIYQRLSLKRKKRFLMVETCPKL